MTRHFWECLVSTRKSERIFRIFMMMQNHSPSFSQTLFFSSAMLADHQFLLSIQTTCSKDYQFPLLDDHHNSSSAPKSFWQGLFQATPKAPSHAFFYFTTLLFPNLPCGFNPWWLTISVIPPGLPTAELQLGRLDWTSRRHQLISFHLPSTRVNNPHSIVNPLYLHYIFVWSSTAFVDGP